MEGNLSVTDAYLMDVEAISRIDVVPMMLDTVCQLTGMRFAAIARVTDERWIACSVRDDINFGLQPGGELKVETTICHEIRQNRQAVVISDVDADPVFAGHHTPALYGLKSYISVPIVMPDGRFFGTLCAIDSVPHDLDRAGILPTFEMFARLIALQLEQADSISATLAHGDVLRNSEARHRQILDSASDFAIIAMNLEGKVTRWNRGAESILDWSEAEMLDQPADRFFTPEDRAAERAQREMQLAAQHGTAADERWHVRKSGERFWASGELSPLRDQAGTHVGYVKILRDRTEEHLAGEALRRAQDRFQTIFETVDAAFAIVEVKFDADDKPVDYRFVEANPAFERQSGVNLRGKWVTEFAPDLERFWFETYGHVAKTGEATNFESYAEAFQRWFDVRAVRVGDPADRQIAIIFNDVTARREGEERLRISEALARENAERVQLALEAGAIIGTWHWDLTNDQFTVDEPFARAFGLDPALGRKGIALQQITATVHPDDQPALTEAIDTVIARGGSYAHQYRVRRADGRFYWIEANGRVDHGPDGTALSFPGVLIDVQERRTIQAERDRAVADLRALNETLEQRVAERTADLGQAEDALRQSQKVEAIGQLTGGVAHDFNNLLTVIRGSVDLLRRPSLSDERRQRYIDAIADTADRATKLTNQLLAFARRQSLRPEVFDVGESVRAVGDMVRSLCGSRVRLSHRLPTEPCHIDADRSQFDTAIVNMAVNARDAMKGSGELTITVAATSGMPAIRSHPAIFGEFVTVSLADTGPGISAQNIERIFEPFFTTKDVGEGTGLGLSQVFGFTKQSGGGVIVMSTEGEGATFTMYLPRVEGAQSVTEDAGGNPPLLGEGACVLVVEDNAEVGMFATEALTELGFHVIWAMDGAKALAELARDANRFNIVFSDVMMPGMSGIELGQEIARLYPQLPVVLTSGYSEVLAQGGTHGFELVHKPYSIDTLSRALRKVVRQR